MDSRGVCRKNDCSRWIVDGLGLIVLCTDGEAREGGRRSTGDDVGSALLEGSNGRLFSIDVLFALTSVGGVGLRSSSV